jgi:uncharacterized membrane protein
VSPAGARRAALLLLAALAASVLAWQLARLRSGALWPLLLIVPLLAPLRGLVRGRRYTYAWSTLLVTGYVGLGLAEVVANPAARIWPALIVFVAFALFVALVLYLRLTRGNPPA